MPHVSLFETLVSAAARTLGTGPVPFSTGAGKRPPGAVAEVEYFNPLRCLDDTINHPIDMRFATEEQVSKLRILSRHGTPVGLPS